MTAEEKLDELEIIIENISDKLEKKIPNLQNPENLKKNSHLHIFMETQLHDKLKKEADEKNISLSELARWKLRDNNQLDRIERKMDMILNRK